MNPCSSTDQLVDTTTLQEHIWKTYEYTIEILPWDLQINTLKMEDPAWLSLWSKLVPFPTLFPQGLTFPCLFLSPKKGPFFCLCNLFPESISSATHFFYLCEFLNNISLTVCILILSSFLAIAQVPRLLNQGPV